jgi:hypothetical protein
MPSHHETPDTKKTKKPVGLHDIFQKSCLEKTGPGQLFASVSNSLLHLLGFEAGHLLALLNKNICLSC